MESTEKLRGILRFVSCCDWWVVALCTLNDMPVSVAILGRDRNLLYFCRLFNFHLDDTIARYEMDSRLQREIACQCTPGGTSLRDIHLSAKGLRSTGWIKQSNCHSSNPSFDAETSIPSSICHQETPAFIPSAEKCRRTVYVCVYR